MTTHPPDQDLEEPGTAARALKVSVRTIQRLAEAGEIPHYRVGSQLRFNVTEVLAALRVERSA